MRAATSRSRFRVVAVQQTPGRQAARDRRRHPGCVRDRACSAKLARFRSTGMRARRHRAARMSDQSCVRIRHARRRVPAAQCATTRGPPAEHGRGALRDARATPATAHRSRVRRASRAHRPGQPASARVTPCPDPARARIASQECVVHRRKSAAASREPAAPGNAAATNRPRIVPAGRGRRESA